MSTKIIIKVTVMMMMMMMMMMIIILFHLSSWQLVSAAYFSWSGKILVTNVTYEVT